jgi:hypothetical protein
VASKALVVGDPLMVEFCRKKGMETTYLSGEKATARAIARGIEDLTKDSKPGDKVVFSYSGPGAQVVVKKTKVIHIREAPPGWQSSLDYVYVGRPGKGMESQFGNPFKIGPDGDRNEVLRKYGEHLDRQMAEDEEFAKSVRDLAGRTLICFCRPLEGFKGRLMCHAQILASKATGLPAESFE